MAQDPLGASKRVRNRVNKVFPDATRADDRAKFVRTSVLEAGQGDCGIDGGVRTSRPCTDPMPGIY